MRGKAQKNQRGVREKPQFGTENLELLAALPVGLSSLDAERRRA